MITSEQIEMLKFFIVQSNDANDLGKRLIFFLIDVSKGLTEPVSVSFFQDKDGYTEEEINEVANAIHDMRSSNGTTHIAELMYLMGTALRFSVHYGCYDDNGDFNTEGIFPGLKEMAPGHEKDRDDIPISYTVWLAKDFYDHSEQVRRLVTLSKEDLTKIELTKPE